MYERLVVGDLDRFAIRLILFLASAVFLALSLWNATIVEASHIAWYVYPGIDEDDISEYGIHFDEGDAWFGARDFNHASDGSGMSVWLRVKAAQNIPFPIRYNRASFAGGCGMEAELQLYSGGWTTIGDTELRYLHIGYPATGATSTIQLSGQQIYSLAGTIAHSGLKPECMSGPDPHLHQSANLETLNIRREFGIDSCWVEDGDDVGQCDVDEYGKLHVDCPYDYDDSNPPYSKTGEISGEYTCELWSEHSLGGTSYASYFPKFW
jgi:hypothetical protein